MIVSNDGANLAAQRAGRGVVTVVPVTSNTSAVHPFQVLLPAAASGLDPRIGALTPELIAVLDEALRLHLAL